MEDERKKALMKVDAQVLADSLLELSVRIQPADDLGVDTAFQALTCTCFRHLCESWARAWHAISRFLFFSQHIGFPFSSQEKENAWKQTPKSELLLRVLR